jgi:exopolysaccharide production protein ExoY
MRQRAQHDMPNRTAAVAAFSAGETASAPGRHTADAPVPPSPDYPLKEAFDRMVATLALAALSPLLMLIAALIYIADPGSVFYSQERIGRNGRKFACRKFRSMVQDGDAVLERHLQENPDAHREWSETRKLKDDPRVTPVGVVLRKSSLDELPQLVNIARGEMSLVGPRPIVEDEAPYYGEKLPFYLAVRPGLTGLWQISGRNDVSYDERVRLDTHYVRNLNFLGDLAIILRTVRVVLVGRGSY